MAIMAIVSILAAGCSATHHRDQVRDDGGDRISAGTVQREIRVGMTSAEVAAALGAPNIVTRNNDRQTWIYDKVSTEEVRSSSSLGIFTILVNPTSAASASSTSQRTLTIIVKFDENEKVEDFSYRQSSF